MKSDQQFEKFIDNIKLTSAQRKDAKTKYTGVCKKLHDNYYPDIEYSGSTKLLIGSYGKKTHIRPPRDVDVLFIMPPEKFEQYQDNEGNSQSQLLQDIKKVLSEKYTTADKIKAWGKVVLVKFSEGVHNVELLPAWEKDDGTFIIPNTENGGSWEIWDPKTEIKNIKESDSKTGKTKSLIRMIKRWTDNCSVDLKSFQIENSVLDFFSSNESNKPYAQLVRDFLIFFKGTVNDESVKSHLTTAYNRAKKACEFEEKEKYDEATTEWKKIFGQDFYSQETSKSLSTYKTPQIEDFSHCVPPKWPIESAVKVNIDAFIFTENQERRLGGINSDGRHISPGLSIKFTAYSNATSDVEHYWQVVNTGSAARQSGDLRGGIFNGRQARWEHTKYKGKHWVECFLVQNNRCIGRSGKFFININ